MMLGAGELLPGGSQRGGDKKMLMGSVRNLRLVLVEDSGKNEEYDGAISISKAKG